MPNLRSKVNKRKSDSFVIDNSKARKIATGTEIKRNVQVPVSVQLKSLREAHDALIKENNDNLKVIENLKIQVALLVHRSQSSKKETQESKETQTNFVTNETGSDDKFPCTLCNFQCGSEELLNMHKKTEHGNKTKHFCNVCGKSFHAWQQLMIHKKEKHPTSMKVCKYFLKGYCAFGEEDCWFRHDQTEQTSQTLKELKCSLCGKLFNDKKEFMKHRKSDHLNNVSECKDNENGWCRFSGKECWFKHGDVMCNNERENSAIVQ